ncbi:MAG TPA: hypothetical protein VFK78_04505 [Gemmatimonadales bacterium]|nr:hypothetical protein [Gemmatimonadales bacterium]
MTFVSELWLPIVLSGVLVFVGSFVTWALLPFHNKEWKGLSNENAVLAAIRQGNPGPGLYTIPHPANQREARSKEFQDRVHAGASGHVTIMRPGAMNMGTNMALAVISNILISFFVAYVAFHTLVRGATYLEVFRVVGTIGFLAYCASSVQDPIWFQRPWRSWVLQAIDALVFGMLMGGTFGWLWPR